MARVPHADEAALDITIARIAALIAIVLVAVMILLPTLLDLAAFRV
jgi:hypothetical protein